MKLCIIMMGIPGSGKSHMANRLQVYFESKNFKVFHCSSDSYMVDEQGNYDFKVEKLGYTHGECLKKFENGLTCPSSDVMVIVDNTNVRIKVARVYEQKALEAGFSVKFVESDSPWKDNPYYCSQKNTHGVPLEKIESMYQALQNARKVLKEEGKTIYSEFEEIINV